MTTQTVLIIEDEPSLQEILTYNLESRGYQVLVFDDGTEGLEGVRKHVPDIVLLDIMLPGMDGFEVCRHIRSDPLIKHLPVLMMTARGEEIDQLVGFQMGADDYVTKPFKMRILLERIKSLLRRTEGSTDDESGRLSSDGIVLDRIQFKVTVGDADIAFTPTEFDLLWHLMKHPGRVFNRADLMNAIMGDDTIVLERTIDVHIRALRKKLGDCGDFIETVRGIGYRYKNE
ncbi:MAG: response regulator [Pirellulales bacterium]|jgi:two-component system phosphate regulon response regulator PhoB|tara:strand:- start:293 stop:982 length:690 start_codon:yes stop_codon:yes gene_type:complete